MPALCAAGTVGNETVIKPRLRLREAASLSDPVHESARVEDATRVKTVFHLTHEPGAGRRRVSPYPDKRFPFNRTLRHDDFTARRQFGQRRLLERWRRESQPVDNPARRV